MKTNSKQKKEKSIFNQYGFPILIFVLAMISIISSYAVKMNKKIRSQVFDGYITELSTVANIYNKEIYALQRVTDYVANELSDVSSEDLFNEENIELTAKAASLFSTCNAYLVKNDLSCVDIKGDTYASVSDIHGVAESIEELETYSKLADDKNGYKVFHVVSPITSNNVLNGYVVIEYKPDIMETLTNNPRYTVNRTYALITSDGEVVELCGMESDICNMDKNIVENPGAEYSDGTYTSFKQGILNTRSGHVRIKNGSSDKHIFYSPLENYYASVVMIADQTDVKISVNSALKDIKTFMIAMCIALAIVALTIIGIGIFNKTKHNLESEDLQYKADTDQLTDLYNKSATERLIKEYLAGDGKEKVSMMFVLDIDNFKKINDTQGHAFGDKVLSSLGHQIKSWFRVNDIIGRIGGDEFIIFVKDIKDPEAIKREGSRIMQFFEGFNVGDYTRYSPTASVGGAVFPNDADSFETLYKAADKAVYKSKHEGKNRVSFYADLNSEEREVVGNSEDPEARQG